MDEAIGQAMADQQIAAAVAAVAAEYEPHQPSW
jgi:hypothetical protein